MQQFRPLPRFDEMEEAVPVETPLTATTDPIPTLATTDPIPTHRVTNALPVVPSQTMARIPVVLLSGPNPTADTGQFAALIQKTALTGTHPSLTSALQASLGAPGNLTRRLVVIPAEKKRAPASAGTSSKRLNPRLRQVVMLVVTLTVLIGTLTTLTTLSDNQNGSLFSSLGNWIHSAQLDWQIQTTQGDQGNQSIGPTYLNGPGLPYMAIANSQYVAIAEQDATNAGIPPTYFVRQIQQESGFNPSAVSVTNAEGIAQFEPYTASGLGINPWDPIQALRGAAQLMARYYHQYGNYTKALGAYNAGPGAVQSASYACGANWLSCMPGQSQDYAYRIMGA